jgi:glycerol-3-phosphate acyltransferase PlsX
VKIVLDAMGGDHAPREIVLGALEAAPLLRHTVVLVGDPAAIEAHLPNPRPSNLEIHPASEVIGMDDKPTEALRKKKDSSIVVGTNLVKSGEAQAFVSAGNTGACTAASLLAWRQIHGFHRPAIGSQMPSMGKPFLLLDAGASPDVDPEHLLEFALMGRSYCQSIWGRPEPKVHLMNIGEEPGKGNAFAKAAYDLLAPHSWFAGNIEPKDMYAGHCDVVVCDAFVGNIVLKCAEGTAEMIMKLIRQEVPANPLLKLPYLPLRKVMAPLRKKMDYAEVGGSPLLGLNGLCFIAHGRSNAKAIKNALLQAQQGIENRLVETMRESIAHELQTCEVGKIS